MTHEPDLTGRVEAAIRACGLGDIDLTLEAIAVLDLLAAEGRLCDPPPTYEPAPEGAAPSPEEWVARFRAAPVERQIAAATCAIEDAAHARSCLAVRSHDVTASTTRRPAKTAGAVQERRVVMVKPGDILLIGNVGDIAAPANLAAVGDFFEDAGIRVAVFPRNIVIDTEEAST